jgi:hypothetical protein
MKNILLGILMALSLVLMAADFNVKFRQPKLMAECGNDWTIVADDGTIWELRHNNGKWLRLPDIPVGHVAVGEEGQ